MAGYSENREQNLEIKYLRKVLGEVDARVKTPDSISGDNLRHLLDGVEAATPRPKKRPRWLSLQSGVAYAAAFALIVALFYSLELYKPQAIYDGMRVEAEAQAPAPQLQPLQDEAEPETASGEAAPADTFAAFAADDDAGAGEPVTGGVQEPVADAQNQDSILIVPEPEGIGGSSEATLLLEQDGRSYYWRQNDPTDPDKAGFPISVEVVDSADQQMLTQINIADMQTVERCFVYENTVLVLGMPLDQAGVWVNAYNLDDPEAPVSNFSGSLPGTLMDARIYKNIVHAVVMIDAADYTGEGRPLPNAAHEDVCVIWGINLDTLETSAEAFSGARGTVQLHNQTAYIHYEGVDEDGGTKEYIAQIMLDGLGIELNQNA